MATTTIYRIDFNHEYAGQNTSRLQLILSESFQNWAKLGNALQHTGSIASYPLAWLWAETPQDRLFERHFFEKTFDQIVILMCEGRNSSWPQYWVSDGQFWTMWCLLPAGHEVIMRAMMGKTPHGHLPPFAHLLPRHQGGATKYNYFKISASYSIWHIISSRNPPFFGNLFSFSIKKRPVFYIDHLYFQSKIPMKYSIVLH